MECSTESKSVPDGSNLPLPPLNGTALSNPQGTSTPTHRTATRPATVFCRCGLLQRRIYRLSFSRLKTSSRNASLVSYLGRRASGFSRGIILARTCPGRGSGGRRPNKMLLGPTEKNHAFGSDYHEIGQAPKSRTRPDRRVM